MSDDKEKDLPENGFSKNEDAFNKLLDKIYAEKFQEKSDESEKIDKERQV